MNEIIGPIYYVMASDPRAVTFFVLQIRLICYWKEECLMTNAQTKFLDNHIANQIPFEGLERARGGRLLFLLHQPHVRHQVSFFSTKTTSTAIRISGTSSSRPWTTPPVGSRPLWPDLQRGSNHKKPQPHHRNHRNVFLLPL